MASDLKLKTDVFSNTGLEINTVSGLSIIIVKCWFLVLYNLRD